MLEKAGGLNIMYHQLVYPHDVPVALNASERTKWQVDWTIVGACLAISLIYIQVMLVNHKIQQR